jgi:hypothetical protein
MRQICRFVVRFDGISILYLWIRISPDSRPTHASSLTPLLISTADASLDLLSLLLTPLVSGQHSLRIQISTTLVDCRLGLKIIAKTTYRDNDCLPILRLLNLDGLAEWYERTLIACGDKTSFPVTKLSSTCLHNMMVSLPFFLTHGLEHALLRDAALDLKRRWSRHETVEEGHPMALDHFGH